MIDRFKLELVDILNSYFKRRAKRRGQSRRIPHLTESNIKTIIGSPLVLKHDSEIYLYFTFYSQTGRENMLIGFCALNKRRHRVVILLSSLKMKS